MLAFYGARVSPERALPVKSLSFPAESGIARGVGRPRNVSAKRSADARASALRQCGVGKKPRFSAEKVAKREEAQNHQRGSITFATAAKRSDGLTRRRRPAKWAGKGCAARPGGRLNAARLCAGPESGFASLCHVTPRLSVRCEDRKAKTVLFALLPPPAAARNLARGCDYCRLTRH